MDHSESVTTNHDAASPPTTHATSAPGSSVSGSSVSASSVSASSWGPAVSATLHCLTGCAIGEVLGMVLSSWWGWSTWPAVVLAIALAFLFGYSLTMWSVLRAGLAFGAALQVALAADTVSITVMEVVDNAFVVAIPGAMEAGLASGLFWVTLAASLAIAFVVTVPVNRWLIARGRGHAVMHAYHH
jgi:hypothetical protein